MIRAHFSTKSKISSIDSELVESLFPPIPQLLISRCIVAAFVALATIAVTGCQTTFVPPPTGEVLKPAGKDLYARGDDLSGRRIELAGGMEPPWVVWEVGTTADPRVAQADELVRANEFARAVDLYREIERSSPGNAVAEEAFVRRMGAMLRLGQSREVLDEVSFSLKQFGKKPEDADPRLSFIVAFAHEHRRDIDQALAWLTLTRRKVGGVGELARRSLLEIRRLAAISSDETLTAVLLKWEEDPIVGPIMSREKLKRAQGLRIRSEPDISAAWFGGLYGDELPPANVATSGERLRLPQGEMAIGVLLPFTGKFASYADEIKRGIELAIGEYSGPMKLQLVTADTQGEPEPAGAAYDRLVREQGVSAVLGPLLVKTTEGVAERSKFWNVPFISFTKKKGIPELGGAVFRLGATAEDQAAELVQYATKSKGVKRFAVAFPENESGRELADAFAEAAQWQGGTVVERISYRIGDESSMTTAVQRLQRAQYDALFLPDTLENLQPLLSQLRTGGGEQHLLQPLLLGPALWNDTPSLRGYGALLDGAVFVTPFYTASANPVVVDFIRRYEGKYGTRPGLLAAQGYDAARIVLSSINPSDNSPESVLNILRSGSALNRGELIGVTGRFTMKESGDIVRRMSVLAVQGSEVIEIFSGGVPTGFISEGAPYAERGSQEGLDLNGPEKNTETKEQQTTYSQELPPAAGGEPTVR